ncbi:MAG: acetylglutamate kinase [Tannerella sp.]|jgi:acetylglutamate kinase|nr:acetylglutamate kinase [Tannerella sp.]
MKKLTLVKVGGKIVEDENTLGNLLDDFSKIEGAKVLVHGGGSLATKIGSQLGVESRMVDGRRITDAQTLRIVTMVYAGLVNKNIVARLQALGVNAIGLTGADMNIILAEKRPVGTIDYGFAGDVKTVNGEALSMLLGNGCVPILSPLTHDKKGNLLNTNADTIAAETAKALAKMFDVTLIYCFEKSGVLLDENDDNSVIPLINREIFENYKKEGVISGGMIPKLHNSLQAIDAGVKQVIITKASEIKSGKGTAVLNSLL